MPLKGTKIHHKLEIRTCDPLICTVNHLMLIVSSQMVESISSQRAKCIVSSDRSPDIFGTRQLPETSANQTVEDSTSNRVVSASSSDQDNYKHHQSQHMETGDHVCTLKPGLSGHSKIDKTKVLKTDGTLMQVESIAECSLRAFCNTFDLH